jgi:hypothetical protein
MLGMCDVETNGHGDADACYLTGKTGKKRHTQTKVPVFATGPGRRQTHVRCRAAPTRGVLDP